jgi:hypothetical protein
MPLALASATRYSLSRPHRNRSHVPDESSSRVLPPSRALPHENLAGLPQLADSSHGLLLPSAHEDSKVHQPRALPARFVPPSGFDYPLDGFLPSDPCRPCFVPAALMGFTLRSVPLPRGTRMSPSTSAHLRFSQAFFPPPEPRAGPPGRRSWALTLLEVPGVRRWV